MLINFFPLAYSGGDTEKAAKNNRGPNIDNLCLKIMLQERSKGQVGNKSIMLMKGILLHLMLNITAKDKDF